MKSNLCWSSCADFPPLVDGVFKHVTRRRAGGVDVVDPLVDELVERLRAEQGGQHRAELCRLRRHKIFAVKLHLTVRLSADSCVVVTYQTKAHTHRLTMPELCSKCQNSYLSLSLSLSLSLRFYLSI